MCLTAERAHLPEDTQPARKHGISRATYSNWRSKYGGVTVNELKRMKELVGLSRTAYYRVPIDAAARDAAVIAALHEASTESGHDV